MASAPDSSVRMPNAPDSHLPAPPDLSFPMQSEPPVLPGAADGDWWIRGNYGPVTDEIESLDLEVLGTLPPELNGYFLRNGPNPQAGESPFWLMGDGMLHGVHLSGGRALSYRNRWIQTEAYTSGNPQLLSNLGNTALTHHGGKLLALYEMGPPHEITMPSLETVGPYTFDQKLLGPMTAHPKIDPVSGELFFIGYSPIPPHLRFHTVSPAGELVRTEDIDLPQGVMMHDFQLTQNYAVFFDLPMIFDLTQNSPFPVRFDAESGARIGIMPRTGTNDDVRWFDIDPCFVFHTMNAYENGEDELIIEGCRLESIWADGFSPTLPTATPWQWTLNLASGQATESQLLDTRMDFPIIDLRKQGREHGIHYGLHLIEGTNDYPMHPDGVLKYDRASGTSDSWICGHAAQPDEPLFVPDPNDTGEDAGWLITMVYNRADDISEVVVLDAQEVSKGPIARVKLPRRVPFGFHGVWVPDPASAT